jgi:hypothetical protein
MPSLEPIKGKFPYWIQGYLIIIQIKSAILFAILAIPDNSGIDVHFHLPTPASQHQRIVMAASLGQFPLIIGFPSKANCRTSLNLEEK